MMTDHLAMLTTPPMPAPWHLWEPHEIPLSELFPNLRPNGTRYRPTDDQRRQAAEARRANREAERAALLRAESEPLSDDASAALVRALASRLGSASALALHLGTTPFRVRLWARGIGISAARQRQLATMSRFYGINHEPAARWAAGADGKGEA